MKPRSILFILLALFLATIGFSEETTHVIQRGETIYSIARSYGVSVQAVLSLNGISDARTVQPGQRLKIPLSGSASGASPSVSAGSGSAVRSAYSEYTVEKNDTLYSIARRYSISVEELREMNGYSPNYVLKAGEKIRIPAQGQTIASGTPSGKPAGTAAATATGAGTTTTAATAPNSGARPDPSVKWPVSAKEVSYITGKLYGVQVTSERREPVKSLTQGTVVSAGPYRGFGRVAIVQMAGGYLYVYGGCETLSVKEGDKVVPGTELGKLGVDAKSAKPQLFFFVYRSNNPVDPAKAPRA
jgi:murein DD-endopeptidase MepM/ murein hydrolase activator NlpD